MTREEEKHQAANNAWNIRGLTNQEQKIPYKLGFLEGFDYADQHPRKGLWNAQKVIEWLKNNASQYMEDNHKYGEGCEYDTTELIYDLTKAMED